MQTYLLVKADGTVESVESEHILELEEIQKLVGGRIEVTNAIALEAYINADGYQKGLPRNRLLTNYVGNVLIGKHNQRGAFVGLGPKQLQTAKEALALKK